MSKTRKIAGSPYRAEKVNSAQWNVFTADEHFLGVVQAVFDRFAPNRTKYVAKISRFNTLAEAASHLALYRSEPSVR